MVRKLFNLDVKELTLVHKKDGNPAFKGASMEFYKTAKPYENLFKVFNNYLVSVTKSLQETEGEDRKKVSEEITKNFTKELEKTMTSNEIIEYLVKIDECVDTENDNVMEDNNQMERKDVQEMLEKALGPITEVITEQNNTIKNLTKSFEAKAKEVVVEKTETPEKIETPKVETPKPEVPEKTENLEKTETPKVEENEIEKLEKSKEDLIKSDSEYQKKLNELEEMKKSLMENNPEIQKINEQIESINESQKDESEKLAKSLKDLTKCIQELTKSQAQINNKVNTLEKAAYGSKQVDDNNQVVDLNKTQDDDIWAGMFFGN